MKSSIGLKSIKKSKLITSVIVYILLIIGSIVMLLPLLWLVRSSLMEQSQIFIFPPEWIPKPLMLSNFHDALTILPFARYFLNTAIIVIFVMIGVLLTSSLCAYSFARLRWPKRDLIFGILLSSMMLPYIVTIIPTFILWKYLGGINTFYPLIIPSWFGGGMFNIFLLRQFFMTIPKDLDEAALIDGANYFQIYSRIILPLSRPALITIGIFTFMGTWNDFLGPLIYLNDQAKYTLALGLAQFQGMYNAQWNLMMAASLVVIIPIIVLFFIGQNYFIKGITLTGLKG